jgi:hypothetical protein
MSTIKNISLYIPHIFANYSKNDVVKVFEDLSIGKVKNIDFISKMGNDNKPYNAAYIHFDYWYDNVAASNFQERVLNPKKEARLMYEDPWFWLVLENKSRKIVSGDRKIRIDLGDLNTPEKTNKQVSSPRTPVKSRKNTKMDNQTPLNLNNTFAQEEQAYTEMLEEMAECEACMDECEDAMAECEASMDEDDHYLISIDGRYVQELEQENIYLRNQLAQLQSAYYTESIKSQGLAQALQIVNNK